MAKNGCFFPHERPFVVEKTVPFFRSRDTEMAQDRPKITARWPRKPQDGFEITLDGPKIPARWLQGDPKMVLSFKRNANFAKSAMPSSVLSPRGLERAESDPKRIPNEQESSQDVPRRPEDGPKMVLKRRQDEKNGALV